MNDLIKRRDAIDIVAFECGEWQGLAKEINEQIQRLPSAQPERKTGKWIKIAEGLIVTEYKCSECGRNVMDDTGYDVVKDYPYCHCGAKMESEEREE